MADISWKPLVSYSSKKNGYAFRVEYSRDVTLPIKTNEPEKGNCFIFLLRVINETLRNQGKPHVRIVKAYISENYLGTCDWKSAEGILQAEVLEDLRQRLDDSTPEGLPLWLPDFTLESGWTLL